MENNLQYGINNQTDIYNRLQTKKQKPNKSLRIIDLWQVSLHKDEFFPSLYKTANSNFCSS